MQAVKNPGVQDVRRSDRVAKEVAILLIGCDAQGKDFMEQTRTTILSRHGARIISAHKLAAEQELIIVNNECNREAEIRIVGQLGAEGGSYIYGVAFLDANIDFWGVEFPSTTEAEVSARRKVLQCTLCGCREVTDLDVLESEIYSVHDGVLRYCKQCGASTRWLQTFGKVPDESALPKAVAVSPEPPSSPEPFKNRRRHVRTKVSFPASIRNQGFDDIVLCENVSRGGLCFKSSRRYYEKADIEVAAPYSPGSPCILVPAQIMYVQELPEEKMFRCGVQYLPLKKHIPSPLPLSEL